MSVENRHYLYNKMITKWERCRDAIEGEDAIKNKGIKYLAPLNSETATFLDAMQPTPQYEAYKDRAYFYGATGRSFNGILGVIFRKSPIITMGETDIAELFLDNVNSNRDNIQVFVKSLTAQVFSTSRVGILAEPSAADFLIPHIEIYTAESIINWKYEIIEDKKKLTLLVLQETYNEEGKDEFDIIQNTQYRVFRLINNSAVTAEIWRKPDEGKDYLLYEEPITLMVRGVNINNIPFTVINLSDLSLDTVDDPPLDAMSTLNISHYRNSADLEHGLHFTAIPTPWAAGFSTGTKLYIGSTMAWVSDDPQAKAGFLEFTGQGLASLRETMQDKIEQMATLGSRMLEPPRKAVESSDTHKTRLSSEQSVVASIIDMIEEGLKITLGWVADWMLIKKDQVSIEFNRDFVPITIDPALMKELTVALHNGDISIETYVWNLHRGELYPEYRTIEEEVKAIEDSRNRTHPLEFGAASNVDSIDNDVNVV